MQFDENVEILTYYEVRVFTNRNREGKETLLRLSFSLYVLIGIFDVLTKQEGSDECKNRRNWKWQLGYSHD